MPRRIAKWRVSMEMSGELPSVRRVIIPLVGVVAEAVRSEWVRIARSNLKSSARAYIDAIGPIEHRGTIATIKLGSDRNPWVNKMEEGSGPFDMKPGLLRSPKVKRTKQGLPYMHVPIKQGVPGGGDRGPNVMPWSIYRLAKQMPVGKALKLPSKFSGYGLKTRLSPNPSKWGPYTWKTSPYAGVVKSPIYPGMVGLGRTPMRYSTFRTVSRRSDPNSWIHPGFQAKNLMERAQASVERLVPDIVDRILGGSL